MFSSDNYHFIEFVLPARCFQKLILSPIVKKLHKIKSSKCISTVIISNNITQICWSITYIQGAINMWRSKKLFAYDTAFQCAWSGIRNQYARLCLSILSFLKIISIHLKNNLLYLSHFTVGSVSLFIQSRLLWHTYMWQWMNITFSTNAICLFFMIKIKKLEMHALRTTWT